MKSLVILIAATVVGLVGGQAYVCDIPTTGCTNGMFNQATCECECISPFCHDRNGDCTDASNNCGGNKWAACTKGVNCPWWVNAMKAESCTTGPDVPLGLWKIYSTLEACCNTNFAYSETCDVAGVRAPAAPVIPVTPGPTKHPTIAALDDDDYELIPIKFDVGGLPDDISVRELKVEMSIVLKRILLRLAERIPGLKISSVEERVVLDRNLLKNARTRALERDVTLYYIVNVIRDGNKKFGPLIISEIRDSYGDVLDQIQTFSDTKYFGADLTMNWCTSQNGQFDLCVEEIDKQPSPTPARAPTPAIFPTYTDPGGGGFPGWAIALIVIILLLLLCCIAYFVFAGYCSEGRDDAKEVRSNIYMDDGSRGASAYGRGRGGNNASFVEERSRASKSGSRRSRRSRRNEGEDEFQIVLAEGQDPKFDDDSFTINTYGTRKTRTSGSRRTSDSRRTEGTRPKLGRDPSMYIPGREDRPDPDSNDFLASEDGESSRRYYTEDPPLRPKRDPTMYVEGNYASEDPPLKPKRDPTMYVEGQEDPSVYADGLEDPSVYVEGRRDPTMYVDGASVDGTSAEEYSVGREASVKGYSADPYGTGGIDDDGEEYDQYGFRNSTGEAGEEYARGIRDPYDYEEEDSFQTRDVSVARSERSKKPRKDKKSNRSGSAR